MNLPFLSVKRPVTAAIILAIVVLLGLFSVRKLGLELLPDMNFPVAVVVTSYSGAGPQEVENLVTRPIEEVLQTVDNVDNIQSQSQEGVSLAVVMFNWGTRIDDVMLDLREAIDRIEPQLPEDAGSPRVLKFDPNTFPIMAIGLSGDADPAEMRRVAEDIVQPRLERLEGVASAGVQGGVEREILVEVDTPRLNAYGLTLDSVVQALQTRNLNFPGGSVESGASRFIVRTEAEFDSVDDIREVRLSASDGTPVRLSDIAFISDGYKEQDVLTRVNGVTGVGINVLKETGSNTVQVSRRVHAEMEDLARELPAGYTIKPIFDQADFIVGSIENLAQTAMVGGLLAILVLFYFLRHLRSTIVVALAIPISIIATFSLIDFGGLTLNLISLGGLGLGIGMLVDNAIVVLENVVRHRQNGKGPEEAAIDGANEVGGAITASTLTTIAVFLPIVLVEGLASELFGQMSWTVTYSLVASLFVSLMAVPLFASKMTAGPMLRPSGSRGTAARGDVLGITRQKYRQVIYGSLRRRGWVMAGVTAAFIGTLAAFPLLSMEFMPASDEGQLLVSVELEKGKRLEETDQVMQQVEEIVLQIPELEVAYLTAGGSAEGQFFGTAEGNRGEVTAVLKDLSERKRSTKEVVEELRGKLQIPGAQITVSESSMLSGPHAGNAAPIMMTVKGRDLETLGELAEQVRSAIARVPGTRDAETSIGEGLPELSIVVDEARAAQFGLTGAQVARHVNSALNGQVATRYRVDGEEIDIRVRQLGASAATAEELFTLRLPTPAGTLVPLDEIATIEETNGPTTITRDGQERAVTISASIASGYVLGEVSEAVRQAVAQIRLPAGYDLEPGGQQQDMADAFGDLGFALILAILLVYMIMAAQFESFLFPIGIMATFPLSLIGAILGLLITGRTFNITAFIGIIILAGIIVNNGIVLVDYINLLRRQGLNRNDAIAEAGDARLRPILMTTLTTVLGLFPLALGIGEGAEVQAPLATVVMFGLIVGTLLTLVVVPVMYSYLDDLGRRRWRFQLRRPGVRRRPEERIAEGS